MISHPWFEIYAKYTVRRISGMNSLDRDRDRAVALTTKNATRKESKEQSDEKKEEDSFKMLSSTAAAVSEKRKYAPSPPLVPKSPPSKGRIIMKQMNELQELSDSTMGRSMIKRSVSMPTMFKSGGGGGGSGGGIRSPLSKPPSSSSLLSNSNSSSSSSRTSSRSNSPSQQVSEQSQKRLVRTMLKSNGTPPRASRASPKTGWGTPTRMVSISSSNDNSSTNTMKTMPSPKSSPIPLSLFRSSSSSQSDQTISSASNGTIESIPKQGGLFIHEGQAESFQRIQTSAPNSPKTNKS
jgi:hypothetical protein